VAPRKRFATGVPTKKLHDLFILNSFGVELNVIRSLCCDRINVDTAKQFRNMQLSHPDVLAGNHEVKSASVTKVRMEKNKENMKMLDRSNTYAISSETTESPL
jgi:hypothetical protein